jgi:hypothetical protein
MPRIHAPDKQMWQSETMRKRRLLRSLLMVLGSGFALVGMAQVPTAHKTENVIVVIIGAGHSEDSGLCSPPHFLNIQVPLVLADARIAAPASRLLSLKPDRLAADPRRPVRREQNCMKDSTSPKE